MNRGRACRGRGRGGTGRGRVVKDENINSCTRGNPMSVGDNRGRGRGYSNESISACPPPSRGQWISADTNYEPVSGRNANEFKPDNKTNMHQSAQRGRGRGQWNSGASVDVRGRSDHVDIRSGYQQVPGHALAENKNISAVGDSIGRGKGKLSAKRSTGTGHSSGKPPAPFDLLSIKGNSRPNGIQQPEDFEFAMRQWTETDLEANRHTEGPVVRGGRGRRARAGISASNGRNTACASSTQSALSDQCSKQAQTLRDPKCSNTAIEEFGWAELDGARIPYILRQSQQFSPVKVLEHELLSKFAQLYPNELKQRPSVMSHYISISEAETLNNNLAAGGVYSFTKKDLVVNLFEFRTFYSELKPLCVSKTVVAGGWIQINNSVVPYVTRNGSRLVSLSVIRFAAGLLQDKDVAAKFPTDEESDYLNQIASAAGLDFAFDKKTELIELQVIMLESRRKPVVQDLPIDDPFGAAQFVEIGEEPPEDSISDVISPTNPSALVCDYVPQENETLMRYAEVLGGQIRGKTMNPGQLTNGNKLLASFPPRQPMEIYPIAEETSAKTRTTRQRVPQIIESNTSQYATISSQPNTISRPMFAPNMPGTASETHFSGHSIPFQQATSPRFIRAPIYGGEPVVNQRNPQSTAASSLTMQLIQPVSFRGKTITSLVKDNENYVLLEALNRVFFSSNTIEEFSNVMENILHIPVTSLSAEEERSFIIFYKLPTARLKCSKMVKLKDFETYFTQLNYMFKANQQSSVEPAGDATFLGDSQQAQQTMQSEIPQQQSEQEQALPPKRRRTKPDDDVILID